MKKKHKKRGPKNDRKKRASGRKTVSTKVLPGLAKEGYLQVNDLRKKKNNQRRQPSEEKLPARWCSSKRKRFLGPQHARVPSARSGFSMPNRVSITFDRVLFWEQNPLKMPSTIRAQIDVEKVWKIMRKCSQNYVKMRSKINEQSMNFRNLQNHDFCDTSAVKMVKYNM